MSALDLHHEGGWRAGHDPARIVTLCDGHHRLRHEGKLRIEGSAPSLRFALVDGTPLAAKELARAKPEFSCENSRRAGEPPAPGPTAGGGSPKALGGGGEPAKRPAPAPVAAGFSHENPTDRSAPLDPRRSDRDAELALRALGLSAHEAKRKVRRLVDQEGRAWTAEELLRATLRAA
jgi:hypothetical protein